MGIQDLGMLFQFVGGLGMFLYGMNAMADGLQKSAGSKMQQLLGVLTSNRLLGVLVGAGVTAIIQSSSATTVMVVGFVNAGIINLGQAVGIIMGANIGTTVTSWLVSMSEWGEMLRPEFFAPLLVGIGAFLSMFARSHKKKELGEILLGFGILFIGLNSMSASIKPYRDADIFVTAFRVLGQNPILGVLTGTAVTAIIQSSSASVGILQTLALNGVVNWQSAIFITLGQNIGTCVTALISSAGTHKTAKRAAIIHLLFNVIGTVIFGIVMYILFIVKPDLAVSRINSVEISIFHTIFNVTNTILLFPFANLLVKASHVIVRDKKKGKEEASVEENMLRHLDDRILESPSFAIENVCQEVVTMGKVVLDNLKLSRKAFLENDKQAVQSVLENETTINQLEKMLTEYLVKINNLSLNDNQHLLIKNMFYTISDLERVGDHCENMAELATGKINDNISFSKDAQIEMQEIYDKVIQSVEYAVTARENLSMASVRMVVQCEELVDNLEEDLRERHIERLSQKQCSMEQGVIFLDAISNLERVSDHALNIAGYVRDEQ